MLAELKAIFPAGSPDTIGIHPKLPKLHSKEQFVQQAQKVPKQRDGLLQTQSTQEQKHQQLPQDLSCMLSSFLSTQEATELNGHSPIFK